MELKIEKINFDVPFPSVTWNDTSGVPLNTVSKHYLIEYKEKLEQDLEKTNKIDITILKRKEEHLNKLKKYLERI